MSVLRVARCVQVRLCSCEGGQGLQCSWRARQPCRRVVLSQRTIFMHLSSLRYGCLYGYGYYLIKVWFSSDGPASGHDYGTGKPTRQDRVPRGPAIHAARMQRLRREYPFTRVLEYSLLLSLLLRHDAVQFAHLRGMHRDRVWQVYCNALIGEPYLSEGADGPAPWKPRVDVDPMRYVPEPGWFGVCER